METGSHTAVDGSAVQSTDLADLMPGDVWIIQSTDDGLRRLALVLDTEARECRIHIALISAEVEWASDRDVVVQPTDAGSPYTLVVQTDLVARVWWNQAKRRVGIVSEAYLDEILDLVWESSGPDLDTHRGLANPVDSLGAHRAFKFEELAVLGRLAATSDRRFGEVAGAPVLVDCARTAVSLSRDECLGLKRAVAEDRVHVIWTHAASTSDDALAMTMKSLVGPDLWCYLGMKAQQDLLTGAQSTHGVCLPSNQAMVATFNASQSMVLHGLYSYCGGAFAGDHAIVQSDDALIIAMHSEDG